MTDIAVIIYVSQKQIYRSQLRLQPSTSVQSGGVIFQCLVSPYNFILETQTSFIIMAYIYYICIYVSNNAIELIQKQTSVFRFLHTEER